MENLSLKLTNIFIQVQYLKLIFYNDWIDYPFFIFPRQLQLKALALTTILIISLDLCIQAFTASILISFIYAFPF
jgi:hypothetical protein